MASSLMSCESIEVTRNGQEILNVPAFSVEENERLAVLGPTGAGKSTLLGILDLTVRPDSGRLFWRDEDITRAKPGSAVRRKISMAFQIPLLFKGSVYENVAYGLKLRGASKGERDEKVNEILDLFKVSNLAAADAMSLSGGEAHRVSLARSLVFGPDLLLLDEPMASLDPGTKEGLLRELMEILKKLNVTCVYVTHSREEAFIVADRLAVMEGGRVVQTGTAEDVFYRPATTDIAAFVGAGNILPGRILSSSDGLALIETTDMDIEAVSDLPPESDVTVCIRPEEIFIEDIAKGKRTGRASARNRLPGKVAAIENLGAVARVTVDCGTILKALITRRSLDDLHIGVGMEVIAGFKATSVHVIERGKHVKS
ncbi:MAG: ABC transporter ATP-binding protein [Actinomycetota bacterium]